MSLWITCGSVRGVSHSKIYNKTGYLSLFDCPLIHYICIFHKLFYIRTPNYLSDLIPGNVSTSSMYGTRFSNIYTPGSTLLRGNVLQIVFNICCSRLDYVGCITYRAMYTPYSKHMELDVVRLIIFVNFGSRTIATRTIATWDNCHPDNWHPAQFPPRTMATQLILCN